jgi:hypothetical protein
MSTRTRTRELDPLQTLNELEWIAFRGHGLLVSWSCKPPSSTNPADRLLWLATAGIRLFISPPLASTLNDRPARKSVKCWQGQAGILSSMMYEYILRLCCGPEGDRLSSPAKSQRTQDHRFGAMQMVLSIVEYECDDNLNAMHSLGNCLNFSDGAKLVNDKKRQFLWHLITYVSLQTMSLVLWYRYITERNISRNNRQSK